MNLKEAWERYSVGNPISDGELLTMIETTKQAIEYCDARAPWFHLAVIKMRQDLDTLQSFARERTRCETCRGNGIITSFESSMMDITDKCPNCKGKGFRPLKLSEQKEPRGSVCQLCQAVLLPEPPLCEDCAGTEEGRELQHQYANSVKS